MSGEASVSPTEAFSRILNGWRAVAAKFNTFAHFTIERNLDLPGDRGSTLRDVMEPIHFLIRRLWEAIELHSAP